MYSFGMDSVFNTFWDAIFNIFNELSSSSVSIVRFLTSSLGDLVGDGLIGNLVNSFLPDVTLLSLMFGAGVSIFVAVVLVKFFVGIVSGS